MKALHAQKKKENYSITQNYQKKKIFLLHGILYNPIKIHYVKLTIVNQIQSYSFVEEKT
jgi:predicted phosphodiesterase